MSAAESTVAILAYHKIGEPPAGTWTTWNYVPEETFVSHLELLSERGHAVIDLDTLLRGLARPEILPPQAVLLTFDDGYRSMLHVAEPCLARFGLPAVLFVPTDYVGRTNSFDDGNEPEEPICSWDELGELHRRGVSIQSHSVSHRTFSELERGELRVELARSKATLEARLQAPVDVFAFPFGDNGKEPRAVEAALHDTGYKAACLYKGGSLTVPTETPYRLTRLPMGPDTDLAAMLESAA